MRNSTLFVILSFLLISYTLSAQTPHQPQSKDESEQSIQFPLEKVYLHLDRTYYTSHDDIWFKAYLTDAVSNRLSISSNNLYVELISPASEIIKRLNIRLDNGLGIGDFHLGDSIPSGKYQVRAYTNWMRNFGNVLFFKKEIEIENLLGLVTDVKSGTPVEKMDVQFFPEGGGLIQDVHENVGFKAVDSQGHGCKVRGKVISSDGDTVISFVSNHLGMGNLNFISKKGKTYYAVGTSNSGIVFKTDMPVAGKTGFALHVAEYDKDKLWITVKTNQETLNIYNNQELLLTGTSHGNLMIKAKIKVISLLNSVVIAKANFPEGIARITLEDTLGRPYGERLFYVSRNRSYSLLVKQDCNVCAPRQKVTLTISARDTSDNPVVAFLSLSAVNAGRLQNISGKPNIISYFNLESEIRGSIEQPSYYFDPAVPERLKALDNLLLTQGWRDFVWKYLSDSLTRLDFPMEKGINITGRLRWLLMDKPITNANISMGLFGDAIPSLYFTKTDSTGRYYFDGLNFTGEKTVVISATNKNNRSQGWISLDSIPGVFPKVQYFPGYQKKILNSEVSEFNQEAIRKYNILKKYHLTDTIPLNEVVIKGNRQVKTYENDGNFRYYGEPNYSLTVTPSIASTGTDIIEILQGRVPGLQITMLFGLGGKKYIFYYRGSPIYPRFLINGSPACQGDSSLMQIITLPPSVIDKVEVVSDFAPFIISIFLKKSDQYPLSPVLYSINHKVQGYYQARVFYAPKYDKQLPEPIKPDLRNTVHWEPNIVTDNQGNAVVSFFNSDDKDTVNVQVEGISASGVPLVGKTSYKVR